MGDGVGGAARVRRVLVTGAGTAAGRAVGALLMLRGREVVGADARPVCRPGVDVVRVPAATHPDLAEHVAAAARRAGADLVVPTVPEELPGLCRDWAEIRGAPPALLPPFAAVAAASSALMLARALARARAVRPPVASPPGIYAVSLFVADDPREDVAVALRWSSLLRGDVGEGPGVVRVEAPDVAEMARAAARAAGVRGPAEADVRRARGGSAVVRALVPCLGGASLHAPEVLDAALAALRAPGRARRATAA